MEEHLMTIEELYEFAKKNMDLKMHLCGYRLEQMPGQVLILLI